MRLVLSFLVFCLLSVKASATSPEKKSGLSVVLYETGVITVGRDTVGSDELARYIQERLFKSYMGTGKMYSGISFKKENDNVPETTANVVLGEIKEGQRRALNELCLQEYRKTFDHIDDKKKAKLKKRFPVLFQTTYT